MLKNLKIGKRLLIAFIAVALIASLSGITSIFLIKSVDDINNEALYTYAMPQGDIGKAMLALHSVRNQFVILSALLIRKILMLKRSNMTETGKIIRKPIHRKCKKVWQPKKEWHYGRILSQQGIIG